MAFQVRVRVNKNTIKVLSVASTSEEFEQFTIGDLKRKALSFFPSVNDPERLRVIFGQNELKDSQTFGECGIKHQSLLIIVLKMPGVGGGPPQSRGNESFGKVTETVGLFDRLRISRSSVQSGAEKKIQERDSASQYKGATKPSSDADLYDFSKQWSDPSDASVRLRREEKKEKEKYDQPPEVASSVQPDADLQFLQSLLPALKRMDLRRREHTKLRIQQLVFEAEFNPWFDPHEGMRRTNSKEHLPPKM